MEKNFIQFLKDLMASIFLDKTDSLKTIHIVSGIDSDAHRI